MKIKYIVALLLYFIISLFSPPSVYAQNPQSWTQDRCVKKVEIKDEQNRLVDTVEVATLQGFECLFINIVRVATPIIGLLLFIMLVIGSFKYLTSGGDPKKVQAAQGTFTWAIAGIVIFFGIWFILQLIKLITGVDVTQFIIPG